MFKQAINSFFLEIQGEEKKNPKTKNQRPTQPKQTNNEN